jgi:hypothetical protein
MRQWNLNTEDPLARQNVGKIKMTLRIDHEMLEQEERMT